MGYLSNAGLSYFFGKLKTIFAPISHGHGGATQSAAGFMSAADKKKLDGIAEGANKYSLPTATSNVLGGVKTGANITNNSGVLSVTAANVTNALGYTPPKQDTDTWRPVVNSLISSATDQSLAANQGKILNESKAAMIVLTNENLNDVVTPGFYSSGGSNSVTNKPSNVDHFGLIVIHRASGGYYTQIIYSDSAAYRRHCVNGTWSGWVQDKLTDTDTWRGIQNNLTSDSTTDSLSAAQGKALKALIDGKAASGHTHKSVIDNGDGTNTTTFAYSKAGMNYGDYTWLAGWNGYELRAINKNQFATASHIKSFNDTSNQDQMGNNFMIGNGSSSATSNAFRITSKGKAYGGTYSSSGADYAEMFEWQDGNPDGEDRRGMFVTLDGKYIRLANSKDTYILGIVSGNPTVLGDTAEDQWADMYERDIFGALKYDSTTENGLVLNPNYDNDKQYIARGQRKEWDAVGLMGKLVVVDDGTCEVNGFCAANDNGIGTKAETGYRVMERLDENHIRVFVK